MIAQNLIVYIETLPSDFFTNVASSVCILDGRAEFVCVFFRNIDVFIGSDSYNDSD